MWAHLGCAHKVNILYTEARGCTKGGGGETVYNNRFDVVVPPPLCAKLSNRAMCPCCWSGLWVPGTDIERYRSITCSIRT